jgi:hypothetical protein
MSRSYTSSPPKRLHGVERDCFTFFLPFKVYNKRKRKKQKIKFTSVCKVCVSYAVNLVGSVIPRGKKNLTLARLLSNGLPFALLCSLVSGEETTVLAAERKICGGVLETPPD